MQTIDLYGGAMRMCLPDTFTDASNYRQVPDNQEVYTDAETGACVIVELLSRQRDVPNAEAGTFFFFDLAKDNGCAREDVAELETAPLPLSAYPKLAATSATPSAAASRAQACDYACLTTGLQRIAKFNEAGRENAVAVALAVLRFDVPVATEVLVSLSCPAAVHPGSSEARVVRRLLDAQERQHIVQAALASLEVVDWGLFVPEA